MREIDDKNKAIIEMEKNVLEYRRIIEENTKSGEI